MSRSTFAAFDLVPPGMLPELRVPFEDVSSGAADLAVSFATLLGDLRVELRCAASPDAVFERLAELIAVLRGSPVSREDRVLRAAQELRAGATRVADDVWRARFDVRVQQLADGLLAEAELRAAPEVPAFARCLAVREVTTGVAVAVELAELAEGLAPGEVARQRATLPALTRQAGAMVALAADIRAFDEALVTADRANLGFVLAAGEGMGAKAALARAAELYEERRRRLGDAVSRVDATDREIQRCLEVLRRWTRAALEPRHGARIWTNAPPDGGVTPAYLNALPKARPIEVMSLPRG